MDYVTSGYEPRRVFEIFEDLCAIPHGSGNEGGAADYVEQFAKTLGLFCLRDEMNNVFVRKDATAGYEQIEPIMLQGHLDMVCEKNADSSHDFEHDGLSLSVRDGYLWADGTTLGADNGIAVAMMLALLETGEHPTIECLFTVEEETGLGGAEFFDCSVVTARRMINLDSEEEWQITAGCAGGVRTEVEFAPKLTPVPKDASVLKISVTGLSGGHSGAEIHCGKANAINVMARLLGVASEASEICLVDANGGGKDNAIARECFATVCALDGDAVRSAVLKESEQIRKELNADDEGFTVDVSFTQYNGYMCADSELTKRFIYFLSSAKTGVLKMSNQIAGLVEYSCNAGILKADRDGIRITFSARSSLEAQLDLSIREFDMLCALAGAKCEHYSRYPGWEYRPDSKLRELYSSSYKSLFGKELTVGVIHAGLECGILSSKLGEVDVISVGPNMFDIHSPCEHLDLASCHNVWKTLLAVVKSKI
jgi:dipeptidase D